MNFLFGKKKAPTPSPMKTMEKLKEALGILEKRELYLESQMELLSQNAVLAMKKNQKPKAINFLRKKKLLEKQVENIFGQKLNLETQISVLSQAIVNKQTIEAINLGKQSMADMENKVDPDKVSDLIEDIAESVAKVEEVSNIISRPFGVTEDDDELLEELTALEIAEPDLSSLPLPPEQTKKESKDAKEARELKELEALMN